MMTIEAEEQQVAVAADDKERMLREVAQKMILLRRVMKPVAQRNTGTGSVTARLGDGQLHALIVLAEEGMLSAGELANQCYVADPTMSRTLNIMETNGLIVRQTDPRNRRTVLVKMTPKGAEALQQAEAERLDVIARAFSPLTTAQLQDMLRAFGHLESLVDSPRSTPPSGER